MMKWNLPAKTFLVGEYAALADRGAVILTTQPCFEVALTDRPGLHGIHPDSPAGRWWALVGRADYGLSWTDPYHHCGGVGASSAQFLGAFLASCFLKNQTPEYSALLEAYWQCAWAGKGLRPSGYDVMAQSMSGCVWINRREHQHEVFSWPFPELAFIVVHTGQKLATHQYLQAVSSMDAEVDHLNSLVNQAVGAFRHSDSQMLIDSVNGYHHCLQRMNCVAQHTLDLISTLDGLTGLLAMKGCGAMGADTMICLTTVAAKHTIQNKFHEMNLKILASCDDIYRGPGLQFSNLYS